MESASREAVSVTLALSHISERRVLLSVLWLC